MSNNQLKPEQKKVEIKEIQEDKEIKETQAQREARLKKEAKQEVLDEQEAERKKEADKRDKKIKEIQKKRVRSDDDKSFLRREMNKRAQDNRNAKKDLSKLYPSQMTLLEMIEYCDDNSIEVKEGDSTVMLRTRIKAFRSPAQADKLAMLEDRKNLGKIIR